MSHIALWARPSLFRRFKDTNVYGTVSVKIWTTGHKLSVDIRIFFTAYDRWKSVWCYRCCLYRTTYTKKMELASSVNGSSRSLLVSAPVLTLPYISVISLASVVGTLGNLLVIGSLSGSVGHRHSRTVGRIFIVNLACSDLIVTFVINPVAVAGMCREPAIYMSHKN